MLSVARANAQITVTSVTVPSPIQANGSVIATVTISQNAPAGGVTVYLYSDRLGVPSTVPVAEGTSASTFEVEAPPYVPESYTGRVVATILPGTETSQTAHGDATVLAGGTPPSGGGGSQKTHKRVHDNPVPPPTVKKLRISAISLYWVTTITWEPATPSVPLVTGVTYRIWRDDGFVTDTTNTFYVDNTGWASGSSHHYDVQVVGWTAPNLPLADENTPPEQIVDFYPCDPSDLEIYKTSLPFVPNRYPAFDAQYADSRLDPRYAVEHNVNFQFGERNYRGGLSVGYAPQPDSSKIARSYVKFCPGALGGGQFVQAASINLWYTRTALQGQTVTIGAHLVDDDGWPSEQRNWNPLLLTWSPTDDGRPAIPTSSWINPAQVLEASKTTVGGTTEGWVNWKLDPGVMNAFEYPRYLTVGLAAVNESQPGWAYFTKRSFVGKAPYLVWAVSNSQWVFSLYAMPWNITGTEQVKFNVWLNGPAPPGGAVVRVWSDNPFVARAPAAVLVEAGAMRATFYLTVSSQQQTDVKVYAAYPEVDGEVREVTLKVAP